MLVIREKNFIKYVYCYPFVKNAIVYDVDLDEMWNGAEAVVDGLGVGCDSHGIYADNKTAKRIRDYIAKKGLHMEG